jgi:hypothetical protein
MNNEIAFILNISNETKALSDSLIKYSELD